MSDIVAFIRARLDEDEQIARDAVRWSEGATEWSHAGEPDWVHIACHDPARVLFEVDAKRQIVDLHGPAWIQPRHPHFNDADLTREPMVICRSCEPERQSRRANSWPCRTVRLLALPFAGHPDYDETWRP